MRRRRAGALAGGSDALRTPELADTNTALLVIDYVLFYCLRSNRIAARACRRIQMFGVTK